MAEVLFYHLTSTPLERSLPEILEKALERGWRVLVHCGSGEMLERLDTVLWTFRDEAFLPHGRWDQPDADRQPVLLCLDGENRNNARVLICVDGVMPDPSNIGAYDRACLMFDGGDPQAVERARAAWKENVAAGHAARYWAQESGRWVEKART